MKKPLQPIDVFLIISLSGIILFLLAAPFKGKLIIDWVMMENNTLWSGSDYFRHIHFTRDLTRVYIDYFGEACFPPLAYLFYRYLTLITRADMYDNQYAAMLCQLVVYLMVTILAVLLLCYSINKLRLSSTKKNLLMLCILFSVPMFGAAIERGNSALYVVGILLPALRWKDSESKLKKEAALILIAIAAGLKIYPAFMGLLYLREHRWGEAARLIIYGAVLFFVPFVFCGGMDGFTSFMQMIANMGLGNYTCRIQFFKGILYMLGINDYALNNMLNLFFLLALMILTLVSRDNVRALTFLCSIMIFFPGKAYRYTLCYFIIPLVEMFYSQDNKKEYYPMSLLLGALFSIPTFMGFYTDFYIVRAWAVLTMTTVEIYIYVLAWSFLLMCVAFEIIEQVRAAKVGGTGYLRQKIKRMFSLR